MNNVMLLFNKKLDYTTRIPAGTPILDAVKALIKLQGIRRYRIDDVKSLTIPYDIEMSGSDTVYDFLEEISNLYEGFSMYINSKGYFVFDKSK